MGVFLCILPELIRYCEKKKIKDVEVKTNMTVITDHRDVMKVTNVTIKMLIKSLTEAKTQM